MPSVLTALIALALSVAPTRAQTRHDVVLILTDDQPHYTLDVMPAVDSLLARTGVSGTNFLVSTAICCPSRASILTGQFVHTHGVLSNDAPRGGATKFNDTSTLATWLDAAGYRTALIGKYMNEYKRILPWPYVPPGWDRWVAFHTPDYRPFTLVEDGVEVYYGGAGIYSTDVLTDKAVEFIESTPAGTPLFLMYTPFAPHEPADFVAEDKDKFPSDIWRPPNFNEADVSDKPQWVQQRPQLPADSISALDVLYRKMLRSLQPVDRGVAAIADALQRTGRWNNAVVIFTSDNGLALGAHRWKPKACVYEDCTRVPFVVKAPGVLPRVEDRVLLNVDLAPSIATWAGLPVPASVDGQSMVAMLQNPQLSWRDDALLEQMVGDASGNLDVKRQFSAIRTQRYVYVEYDNGDRELYDLAADPWQLTNAVNDPAYAGTRTDLDQRLAVLQGDSSAANAAPTAAFTSACTGLSCSFTDGSSDSDGTLAAWSWDFGDGGASTVRSPSHSYAAGGTYTVQLTVTDDDGAASVTSQALTVQAANVAPTAAFTPACTGLSCSFTDGSSDSDGTLASWSWDFGDGGTSSVRNPSHTYAVGGTYTVRLTVTDDDGANAVTSQAVTALAANVAPTAAFTSACTGLSCSFTDGSSDTDGSLASWSWDFGDGGTSTLRNPSHSYAAGGTYTVRLTVTDDGGVASVTSQALTVQPANVAPTAAFTSACTGLSCSFTDGSSDSDGTLAAWSWDFGDGGTSSVRNPSHSYAGAGTYTVQLTVTDDDGAASVTSQALTVQAANVAPTAAFTPACTGLSCSFTDGSSDSDGTLAAWSWDFGDGGTSSVRNPSHSYATGGTYTVRLTVMDDDGASAMTNQSITVSAANNPPTAAFTSACSGLSCSFTDGSSDSDGTLAAWSWDFGDSAVSALRNPSHSYATGGTYTVRLTVTDDDGDSAGTNASITVSSMPTSIVSVLDTQFSPSAVRTAFGTIVQWSFDGSGLHGIKDKSGMALFDSGVQASGAKYSFPFTVAGDYLYNCAKHTSVYGSVKLPVRVTPTSGKTTTTFQLVWASSLPSGYVVDVQIRRPGATVFSPWLTAQTVLGTSFTPDIGIGKYQFRARLRKLSNGKASRYSPTVFINVK